MNIETPVLKDEEAQQPIPSAWRQTICEIVDALKDGDFQLARNIPGVRQLTKEDAERIEKSIAKYGAQLISLPEDAWQMAACQWMDGYWDALVDLYTAEEGSSDLALSIRVYEAKDGYDFHVQSVHVP